jgi:hypothetical protein
MLKDFTAAQLADALEGMEGHPHNTGGLSMLDEATLAYGWRLPAIAQAQEAFSAARHAHKGSYMTETGSYTDESWQAALDAASGLAAELRKLGNYRLPRCAKPSKFGPTCDMALDDDGECRSQWHLPTAE